MYEIFYKIVPQTNCNSFPIESIRTVQQRLIFCVRLILYKELRKQIWWWLDVNNLRIFFVNRYDLIKLLICITPGVIRGGATVMKQQALYFPRVPCRLQFIDRIVRWLLKFLIFSLLYFTLGFYENIAWFAWKSCMYSQTRSDCYNDTAAAIMQPAKNDNPDDKRRVVRVT